MQADNVSLDGLKAFVKAKSGPYHYLDLNDCAFAQYLKSLGYGGCIVAGDHYSITDGYDGSSYLMNELHDDLATALEPKYGATFEALSERLDALK